tara:strand:- start:35 stop:208 length:174 start_codon:yes stop_codon:yes gene_type:complete
MSANTSPDICGYPDSKKICVSGSPGHNILKWYREEDNVPYYTREGHNQADVDLNVNA